MSRQLSGVVGVLVAVVLLGVMVDRWWQFEKLKDPDPTARIEVIDELSNIFCSDSEAVGALINLAKKDKDTSVRAHAVRGLGNCKDASAIEPLILALNTDPDPAVRKEAFDALRQFKDARATEALKLIASPQTEAPATSEAAASDSPAKSDASQRSVVGWKTPDIEITDVQPVGSGLMTTAKIGGRSRGCKECRVVLYINFGRTDWYLQPFEIDVSSYPIDESGVWQGLTRIGHSYAALLVTPGYSPPARVFDLPTRESSVLSVSYWQYVGARE